MIPAVAQNPPSAQTPLNERVLVVYNSNARIPERGQKDYMAERKIPQANRCRSR